MTIYSKAAGAWHHVAKIFYKASGAWKRVNAAYVKQGGVWKQTFGRHNYSIFALGLSQTIYPAANKGIWMDGVQIESAGRSYNLIQFDKYGNMIFSKQYDVFGEDQYLQNNTNPVVTGQIDGLTNDLNAMPNGQLFALVSYDEPYSGRLRNSLPAAVYRVGGTSGIYGNANFAYRSAYLLIGKVGSAPLTEQNVGVTYPSGAAGTGTGDPNAAIAIPCFIWENNWYNGSA
ncbi:hypothetical protein AVU38_gp082 [Ralstonia phage RSL2]|uniref:Uncharacterized protein n=1 Tax=Ralstonia phage RSL2 TaxID=1585840 RepID=A0A0A8J879_9CAUD|nr:hypothetical protein AVU38_gp082 [Ralstonia phage RSL2]BAQ02610.1 hypothetical protein [Ralstonia phage RSL2]